MNILLTGAGGPAADVLWRHWEAKYQLHLADCDTMKIHPDVPSSRVHSIPKATDSAFLDGIRKLVKDLEIDLIISQVDEELVKLKGLETENSPLMVMSPNIDFINMCLDKLVLGKQLAVDGVIEPGTMKLETELEFCGKPLIFKPVYGRGSRGVYLVKTKAQFDGLKKYLLNSDDVYVAQKYIDGAEFTVQIISDQKGKISAIVPLEVIEKRGSTTQCKTNSHPKIIEVCAQVHALYRPTGTYNIQLIFDSASDLAYIIEINPRVSTTMCFSLELGIDPIEVYLNGSSNIVPEIPLKDLRLDRYWINNFTPLVSGE